MKEAIEQPGAKLPWEALQKLVGGHQAYSTEKGWKIVPNSEIQLIALIRCCQQEDISWGGDSSLDLSMQSLESIGVHKGSTSVLVQGGAYLDQLKEACEMEGVFLPMPWWNPMGAAPRLCESLRYFSRESIEELRWVNKVGELAQLTGRCWGTVDFFLGKEGIALSVKLALQRELGQQEWSFSGTQGEIQETLSQLNSISKEWTSLEKITVGDPGSKQILIATMNGCSAEIQALELQSPIFSRAQGPTRSSLIDYLKQHRYLLVPSQKELVPRSICWRQIRDPFDE